VQPPHLGDGRGIFGPGEPPRIVLERPVEIERERSCRIDLLWEILGLDAFEPAEQRDLVGEANADERAPRALRAPRVMATSASSIAMGTRRRDRAK
jgi:hypothetical protein